MKHLQKNNYPLRTVGEYLVHDCHGYCRVLRCSFQAVDEYVRIISKSFLNRSFYLYSFDSLRVYEYVNGKMKL